MTLVLRDKLKSDIGMIIIGEVIKIGSLGSTPSKISHSHLKISTGLKIPSLNRILNSYYMMNILAGHNHNNLHRQYWTKDNSKGNKSQDCPTQMTAFHNKILMLWVWWSNSRSYRNLYLNNKIHLHPMISSKYPMSLTHKVQTDNINNSEVSSILNTKDPFFHSHSLLILDHLNNNNLIIIIFRMGISGIRIRLNPVRLSWE